MKKGYFSFLLIFLALLGVDFFIKRAVYLHVFDPIVVWKQFLGIDFFIQYVTNRGGAWGMLANYQNPLLILRVFVIIGLFGYLWRSKEDVKKSIYITFILAGASGNVLDTFLYGHVIDMFHFVFWGKSYGIFNFADAMIFLGCFGLIVHGYRK